MLLHHFLFSIGMRECVLRIEDYTSSVIAIWGKKSFTLLLGLAYLIVDPGRV